MSWGMAALFIGSTLLQMNSQKKAARAEQEASIADANAKRIQAFELLDRVEFNITDLKKQGAKAAASQKAAFIKGGVYASEGTPLDVLNDTFEAFQREELIQRKEAQFKADQLFAGADVDTRLSGDISSAAKTQQAATLLGGAANVLGAFNKG